MLFTSILRLYTIIRQTLADSVFKLINLATCDR
jgi:hypothetical protein